MSSVRLTSYEVFVAAQAGVRRRLDAIKKGRRDTLGQPAHDLWGMDIEACCAEAAVAKLLGRWWLGSAVADDPNGIGDVGRGFEVRSTPRQSGCLIVHPSDPDDALFYLAVGQTDRWEVFGPILGEDAKQDRYWREGDGRPAFFVPQQALIPLSRDYALSG